MPEISGDECGPGGREFPELGLHTNGADTVDQLLESFRPYLLALANHDLPDIIRGKCSGSDLVQETLLEAHRDYAQFIPDASESLRSWLRQLLRNNLADAVKYYRLRGKRSVDRERSLHHASAAATVIDHFPTPCTHAVAREEMAMLDVALDLLTPDERSAILLRHREHLTFDEIGQRLGRTGEAARKLWSRSIRRLQRILASDESSPLTRSAR